MNKFSEYLEGKFLEWQHISGKRPTLEALANQVRTLLTSAELPDRKAALRMLIRRILVRRLETEIRVLIEYHLPESKLPSEGGGEFGNKVCGPDGFQTLLITLPIRKYQLTTKS